MHSKKTLAKKCFCSVEHSPLVKTPKMVENTALSWLLFIVHACARVLAAFVTSVHQEDYTMKSGFVVEEGTGVVVLVRAAAVSEEFFTRGKEFVPERWGCTEHLTKYPRPAVLKGGLLFLIPSV